MRRVTVVAVGITALVGLALPGVAQADDSCPDGHVCVWNFSDYKGDKYAFAAHWAGTPIPVGYRNSIKNRFGNRKVRFTTINGQNHCVDANGERGAPSTFKEIFIGEVGSYCN